MPKGDSIIESIFKVMALIGGAWLTIEVLKALSKKVTYYDCPKCGNDVKYGQYECDNCGTELGWDEFENIEQHESTS